METWRAPFLQLLQLARSGTQFPDAQRWRALAELLGREGRKPTVALRADTGLPSARALTRLHRMQFVARAFLAQHRLRPSRDARAFSLALAALELPDVASTSARLIAAGAKPRFLVVHDQLTHLAQRFTFTVEQRGRGPITLGKDQLAAVSEGFAETVRRACLGSAASAFGVVAGVRELTVQEVVRGELGPFVSGAWALPANASPVALALRELCRAPTDAVLCVALERVAADVAQASTRDPWAQEEPALPGHPSARERRLFCTPGLEGPLRALVGPRLLIRSG